MILPLGLHIRKDVCDDDDDDVYYYIRWRLKLEGETENMGVCTKERKGVTAAVLMAAPCTNPERVDNFRAKTILFPTYQDLAGRSSKFQRDPKGDAKKNAPHLRSGDDIFSQLAPILRSAGTSEVRLVLNAV